MDMTYSKLYESNNVFRFSAQIKQMKKVLLRDYSSLISQNTSKGIYLGNLDYIRHFLKLHRDSEDMSPLELSFIKENFLINSLRAMKSNLFLDERLDIDLLQQYHFKESHIKEYFYYHYNTIFNFLEKISYIEKNTKNHMHGRRIDYTFDEMKKKEEELSEREREELKKIDLKEKKKNEVKLNLPQVNEVKKNESQVKKREEERGKIEVSSKKEENNEAKEEFKCGTYELMLEKMKRMSKFNLGKIL